MILAIDPGPEQSAYAVLSEKLEPLRFDIVNNPMLLNSIPRDPAFYDVSHFALEMVASYGMAVGADVFETVFWIGRFWEAAPYKFKQRIYRKDVKLNLCQSMRANDSNVRRALIDRFAQHDLKNGKGTQKKPDWFYGVKDDIWSAIAVGVTYADQLKINREVG